MSTPTPAAGTAEKTTKGRPRPARAKRAPAKRPSHLDMSGRILEISVDAVAASLAANPDRRTSFA